MILVRHQDACPEGACGGFLDSFAFGSQGHRRASLFNFDRGRGIRFGNQILPAPAKATSAPLQDSPPSPIVASPNPPGHMQRSVPSPEPIRRRLQRSFPRRRRSCLHGLSERRCPIDRGLYPGLGRCLHPSGRPWQSSRDRPARRTAPAEPRPRAPPRGLFLPGTGTGRVRVLSNSHLHIVGHSGDPRTGDAGHRGHRASGLPLADSRYGQQRPRGLKTSDKPCSRTLVPGRASVGRL